MSDYAQLRGLTGAWLLASYEGSKQQQDQCVGEAAGSGERYIEMFATREGAENRTLRAGHPVWFDRSELGAFLESAMHLLSVGRVMFYYENNKFHPLWLGETVDALLGRG